MSEEKAKLEYGVKTTIEECIARLEELVDGMKQGQILLRNHAKAVELRPSRVIALEVKARQKGSRESLSVKMEWKNSDTLSVDNGAFLEVNPSKQAADGQ